MNAKAKSKRVNEKTTVRVICAELKGCWVQVGIDSLRRVKTWAMVT